MIEIKGSHGKSIIFETLLKDKHTGGLIVNAMFHTRSTKVYYSNPQRLSASDLVHRVEDSLRMLHHNVRTFVIYTNVRNPALVRNYIKLLKELECETKITMIFMYHGGHLE